MAAVWLLTLAGADVRGRFLLILLEADSMWPPRPGATRSGYGEWGHVLREQGRYVVAEKLTDDRGTVVARAASEPSPGERGRGALVSGYYIVRAASYEEAVAIARGSPHLRYGGSILVRRIE